MRACQTGPKASSASRLQDDPGLSRSPITHMGLGGPSQCFLTYLQRVKQHHESLKDQSCLHAHSLPRETLLMGPLKAESKVDSRKKSPLGAQRKSPWVMENQRKLTDMVTLS